MSMKMPNLTKLTNRNAYLTASTFVLLGFAAPAAHAAHTFCCSDARSQQRCGDVLPVECRNRAYVEYNESGIRVRSNNAPLTEAQQATKDAEDKKKRDLAEAVLQQQRSDQALLSTYADEKDLDTARDRAVGELERSVKSGEERQADLAKDKAKLVAESNAFKGKPLPYDMKQKIARNESDAAILQKTVTEKKQELEDTKAKFEGFRKRLQELKAKDTTAATP